MRIFLVRHGESRANVDWSENKRVADHAIELTDEGKQQAEKAGETLAEYLTQEHQRMCAREKDFPAKFLMYQIHLHPRIRLWNSPYMRTRQTRDHLMRTCLRQDGQSWFCDHKEHFLLHEQQFGIFDGLSDEERTRDYPMETAYYEKCKKFEGKVWAKFPMGESRIDVARRMHQAFGTFKRDEEDHGIKTIVVVGHGTTNRCFTMAWLHLTPEWLEKEPNPLNCSIRLIENGVDKGYIFKGFEPTWPYFAITNKETEE